jgi:hypothetical protein
MDVGVDTHDFRPWHYDEINALMAKKEARRANWKCSSEPQAGQSLDSKGVQGAGDSHSDKARRKPQSVEGEVGQFDRCALQLEDNERPVSSDSWRAFNRAHRLPRSTRGTPRCLASEKPKCVNSDC